MQIKPNQAGLLVAAILSVIGLSGFSAHVWKSGSERSEFPGITVRNELTTIFAPRALIDFVGVHPMIETREELVRGLREAKLERTWFALRWRNHQANGETSDLIIVYRPGERGSDFATTTCVLNRLAGKGPAPTCDSIEQAEIMVTEGEFATTNPLGNPTVAADE